RDGGARARARRPVAAGGSAALLRPKSRGAPTARAVAPAAEARHLGLRRSAVGVRLVTAWWRHGGGTGAGGGCGEYSGCDRLSGPVAAAVDRPLRTAERADSETRSGGRPAPAGGRPLCFAARSALGAARS